MPEGGTLSAECWVLGAELWRARGARRAGLAGEARGAEGTGLSGLFGLSCLSGWQNRIDRIHQMNEIDPLANGILPNGKARGTEAVYASTRGV